MKHWINKKTLTAAGIVIAVAWLGVGKPLPTSKTPEGVTTSEVLSVVPSLYINTNKNKDGDRLAIDSRNQYTSAKISVDGKGAFSNLEREKAKIRLRGNSTFGQAKKPYKIKFKNTPTNTSFLGFEPGRTWILLANFHDGTLMTDILGQKIAKLANVPFSQNMIPVELYLNNDYQGVYMLTPHKNIGESRINIDKSGYLIELTRSKSYSKDPKNKLHYLFTSQKYMLPIYIRHPSLDRIYKQNKQQARSIKEEIRTSLQKLENSISSESFPKHYGKFLDKQSLARMLLVHQLTRNAEISHPKSIYLHKNPKGKFVFGPAWDFDWAYGGSSRREFFIHGTKSGAIAGNQPGGVFFNRFLEDEELLKIFSAEWDVFKKSKLDELTYFIDTYVNLLKISGAYQRDYDHWSELQNTYKNHERKSLQEYQEMVHSWLDKRSNYIDEFIYSWKKSFETHK